MKKFVSSLLLTAALVSTSSCVSDITPWGKPTGGNETLFRLKLSFPSEFTSKATRAMDFASENTIDNVYVLVFDQNNILQDIRKGNSIVSTPDPNYTTGNIHSATATFAVTLPQTSGSNTSRLAVLANSEPVLSATVGKDSSSSYIGKSYTETIAAIYDGISSAMYPGNPRNGLVPMWGETAAVKLIPGNNLTSIEMYRSIARIDVGVGKASFNSATKTYSWDGKDAGGTTIPFIVTSVTVVRPNNRYAVIPAEANRIAGGIGGPTVPTGTTAFSVADSKTNFTYNAVGGAVSQLMYVPEANIQAGPSGSPGDVNHQNRMALVVGGKYNNSTTTTYYRLDFAIAGNLINVLRNNLYQFNISSATGPGFASVDDAYAAMSMNMTANVQQWDQNNTGVIIFDGTNSLAVTPRDSVKVYSNQYTAISPTRDNAITVLTDVASGWKIDGVYSSNADGSDGTANPSWVSLSPTSGAANTRTDVTVSLDQNTSGAARTANVWISAGRLRYRLRIFQSKEAAIAMRIVDGSNKEITRLTWNAPAGTAPAAQSFTVKWLPATNPVNVAVRWNAYYEFPNPSGNPAVMDGAPYNGESFQPGNGTYTYSVSPPAITTDEVAANPFISKSSRFDFTVDNGYNTRTRSILLTSVNYALLTEDSPQPRNFIYPLGGGVFSYYVRSNTNWKITNVVETARVPDKKLINTPSSTDNVYANASGSPNTTPNSGYREQLTTDNTRRGNSGYADVTYSPVVAGQFNDVTRRIFFPSAQFNIYGITCQSAGSASLYNIYSGQSNSTTKYHLQSMVQAAVNFGPSISGTTNTPSSTVFTPAINVSGYNSTASTTIGVQQITDAANSGADMLIISGGTTWGDDVSQAIFDKFLARQKPVLITVEDPNSFVTLWKKFGSGTIWNSNSAMNGSAPVYQFKDISDPILEGPFKVQGNNMRNAYWGCDGDGSVAYWFSDRTNIIKYSDATNQCGSTDNPPTGLTADSGTTMADGYTCFRFTNVPLIFAADGGFLGAFDDSKTTSAPSTIYDALQPNWKPNYGGGTGTKRSVANAQFIANVIAWAIQRRTWN